MFLSDSRHDVGDQGVATHVPELKNAGILKKELRDFRVKVSRSANETYSAREGQHDDILLSLAVALFVAEHPGGRFVPIQ
jgi:hypothetical protein